MPISISGDGAITGATTSYSFDQSVSVGGTVTYEDVTNVDSVGVITARNGIEVTGGNVHIAGVGATIGVTTAYISSINDLNYPSAGPLSNRNLIINGAMRVAQRGTSISMVTTALFCTDRFKAVSGSSFDWQSTLTQENDGPSGFSKSLKVNVDTASTPTGSHNAAFYYRLEGQDCQSLGYGTNDARTTTLSFWVKSNKTGTYSVQLANNNPTKYLLVEYSINSADTWEYKTMSFVGDTAVTVDNDNEEGLDVRWNLAAGSTDLAAPTNTWVSTAGIRASNDQVNLMDTVNNYWQITGVQLEVGTRATPFEHRSYGDELARCQRYFCKTFPHDQAPVANPPSAQEGAIGFLSPAAGNWDAMWNFPVTMRDNPSTVLTFSPNANGSNWYTNGSSTPNATVSNSGSTGVQIRAGGVNAGFVYWIHVTASAEL